VALSHSSIRPEKVTIMWSRIRHTHLTCSHLWPSTSLQPVWCPPYQLTYFVGIPTIW
jgi:hypothetical protein